MASAEGHAALLESLLEQPQGPGPDAVQLLQLGGRHIGKLLEVGIAGRRQRPDSRCPDVSGQPKSGDVMPAIVSIACPPARCASCAKLT